MDAGAAVLVPDDEVGGGSFSHEVLSLVDDAAERGRMREAARGLAQDRAALALADQVEAAVAPGV